MKAKSTKGTLSKSLRHERLTCESTGAYTSSLRIIHLQ